MKFPKFKLKYGHQNYQSIFYVLFVNLNHKTKIKLIWLFCLIITSALSEIFSIAAIIPFLSLMLPQGNSEWILKVIQIDFQPDANFKLIAGILFSIAVIFSCILRVALLYQSTKISFTLGAEFSQEIYRRSLNRSFY